MLVYGKTHGVCYEVGNSDTGILFRTLDPMEEEQNQRLGLTGSFDKAITEFTGKFITPRCLPR